MYINTETNEYPISESQIRSLFPNTSFPQPFVAPDEYKTVFSCPQPTFDSVTQVCVEGAPVLTDKGHWEQTWIVNELDAEVAAANLQAKIAAAAESVRTQRNAKLTASDWTQVIDAPVDQAAWGAYRQALRDIPQQAGFPLNVTWPDQPN